MNGHDVIWTRPPTFLNPAARLIPAPAAAFQSAMILRFTNDAFMQEFLDVLETRPEQLGEFSVRRETWRGFTPGPDVELPRTPSRVFQRLGIAPRRALAAAGGAAPAPSGSVPADTPLKLYQPANQRHYLVACSLVCKTVGLPDRVVEAGRGERAGYVIRRLLPPQSQTAGPVEGWDEYAWVPAQSGAAWQKVGPNPLQVLEREERLPLFAVHFAENERRRRRLFAGVIPVGRRDAYLGAPRSSGNGSAGPGVTARTSRKILFRKEVIEPWKALVARARGVEPSFTGPFVGDERGPTPEEKIARLQLERAQIQTVSWLILLDLAKYLATYLKPVWRAVLEPSAAAALTAPERAVLDALEHTTLSSDLRRVVRRSDELLARGDVLYSSGDVPATLLRALARYGAAPDGVNTVLERQLENVDLPYDRRDPARRALWPGFLFPLADPDMPGGAALPPRASLGTLSPEEAGELSLDEDPRADDALERIDTFAVLVLRALRDDDARPAPAPAVPVAAIAPANAFEGWFVIRCVYEQPACEPLHGPVVSGPTEPFQLAGFFDPDAPARPIRIGLPIDTTPAGLRKFDKNTALIISDTLCGQIRRIRGITLADLVLSVLPWPFHKDLPNLSGEGEPCKTGNDSLGMICSLSIPIVTICALVLLIIMVAIFDFIFKWLPYFIVCFPLPGLKAKPSGSSG